MKKILVPTDFSANAMKAAMYAAQLAKKSRAAIYLLHVIEPVEDHIRQPFSMHEKYHQLVVNGRMSDLDSSSQIISSAFPDITIVTELAKGSVIGAIKDFAELNQIDLIVMGTKGASGLKEIFMGTVAAGTIGRLALPVITVPEDYEWETPDAILFATNLFEKDMELLDSIVTVANIFSTVIHTIVFVDEDDEDDYIKKAQQHQEYMDFLREKYQGIIFKGEVLEGKDFENTIEKYHQKNEVDLIAIITYPKSIWDRMLNKSTAKKIAFHSKIPLLAVPFKLLRQLPSQAL